MRLILYARKSTESEDRQVQSIADQSRLCEELVARTQHTIVHRISESRSAKMHGTRSGFSRMLALLEQGEADGIVAWHPDRLARNAIDGGWVIDLLDRGKVQNLFFVSYTFDNSPEGKMMLGMIFSQAKYQVDKLSRDVKRGLDSKRAKGWFPHRAPEGYRNDRNTHTVLPDAERFLLLKRAWDLARTGAYTGEQVHRALADWGYRSRLSDKPLARSSVYRILQNPFYTGRFRSGGAWYEGSHEPMVSEADFNRVQEILKRQTPEGLSAKFKPEKHSYSYTGLIRCGQCGCLVTAETKVKHYRGTGRTATYTYYHCTGNKGCRKMSVSPDFFDREMERLLETCSIHPTAGKWIQDVLRRFDERDAGSDQDINQTQTRALVAAQKRREGLLRLRLNGEISDLEFAEYKGNVEEEVASLHQQMRLMEQKQEQERVTLENLFAFSATAYKRFTEGELVSKREVATMMGVSYVLTLENGEPYLKANLHPLLAQIATIEPAKRGFHKGKSASFEPDIPSWLGYVDQIRTFVRCGDYTFPSLPEHRDAEQSA